MPTLKKTSENSINRKIKGKDPSFFIEEREDGNGTSDLLNGGEIGVGRYGWVTISSPRADPC